MSKVSLFIILLFVVCFLTALPQEGIYGFTFIGHSSESYYYLSNKNDKRSVADARTGCHDSFYNGELLAVETNEEHQEVRRVLSIGGITDANRIWTTGQYYQSEWVWYDYLNDVYNSIQNVCQEPWVNGVCPTFGCLAIGGLNTTYKWETDNCTNKRPYICEIQIN